MVIDVGDLAIPHLELCVEAHVCLDATRPTSGLDVNQRDHGVAFLDYVLQLKPVLVPGVEPLIPVPQRCLDAVDGRPVLLDRIPLDLRMENGPEVRSEEHTSELQSHSD